jgi:hypothetical protein
MTRLTSRSDGRGHPLSELIAGWAAGNPRIRRAWLFATRGADSAPPEDIGVTVELQPVGDSEETLAIWMAHCEHWRKELETRLGRPVPLDWRDSDGGTLAGPPEAEERATLVYERVRRVLP